MEQSQSSDASSFTQSFNQNPRNPGPLCHCNKTTMMSKLWTHENPGRRFYRCDVHGFSSWADRESPHGWQKVSLQEARDEIRFLKQELKKLRGNVPKMMSTKAVDSTLGDSNSLKQYEDEKRKLEIDVMASMEREKLLRQFIVLSWGGFIVVTAMILKLVKN